MNHSQRPWPLALCLAVAASGVTLTGCVVTTPPGSGDTDTDSDPSTSTGSSGSADTDEPTGMADSTATGTVDGSTGATTGGQGDDISPAPCGFTIDRALEEGVDYECGDLTVPQRRDDPTSVDIQVHFVRFFGSGNEPVATLYLDGGPGDTGQVIAGLPAKGIQGLAQAGDLVVVSQRGTAFSQPALMCPPPGDGSQVEDLLACADDLSAGDVDLTAFNTPENADDIEDLRLGLGYAQWNLLGISYGTRLALEVMRRHPGSVRATLIDGVIPPDVNWQTEVHVSFWGAIEGLSGACAADPLCSNAYGPLDQALLDMITNLDADPLVVGREGGRMVEITGTDAAAVVRQMMYVSSLYPIIPLVIASFRDRNLEPIQGLLEAFFGNGAPTGGIAQGMHWSVKCSDLFNPEIGPGIDATLMDAQIPEPLATLATVSHDDVLQLCAAWPKPAPEPGLATPVVSDIPTLVSSGSFDPITPPHFGETVGGSLSNAREVVFANSGHGALMGSDCATGMAVAFILDPQGVVDSFDTSCADAIDLQFMVTAQALLEGMTSDHKRAIRRQLRRGR